jgi:lactoylglutathione lyase
MEKLKALFKNAWPYQKDRMNLPVVNVETAVPFYETIMGFQVVSRQNSPQKLVVLDRDGIQIGLAENGGDPTQDGCFFEVDDVQATFAEFNSSGLQKEISEFEIQKHGDTSWKIFFVVAPDGLCYCFGEKQG